MPIPPNGRSYLHVESLEARETPAAFVAETFEVTKYPFLPANWQQWASNGGDYYGLSRTAATSGTNSLAIYGNNNLTSRTWNTTSLSGNLTVWANVRADAVVPVTAFARGQNLNATTASYVGVAVGRGGSIALRETRNGTETSIASLTPKEPVTAGWLRLSYSLVGDSANVRLQRSDDGRYLNSSGAWQVGAVDAIRASVTVRADNGMIGIGRGKGVYGTVYVDDVAGTSIVDQVFAPQPIPVVPVPQPVPVPPPVLSVVDTLTGQKYTHIRLAQLAYSGTPITDFEKTLLKNSIDLVVPNPQYLGTLEQAAVGTPKLIYSNVSNLYQTLLTDWLSYADRTGSPREAAFYHVQRATAFTGSSPSSQPVNWFWNVSRGDTDLTANARGGRTTGVAFGGAGEAVNIGYTDKFRELNVTLSRAAQAGWSGVWEYATANGWKTLSTLSDGTNALRNNGTITFDPPADWAPNRTALYAIRFRTTTGTAAMAPEAKTLFGRDYVNAAGMDKGTIPAFDTAADLDRDGYLNDSEYAKRRLGLDARFTYESRLFYPYYGQMRFVVNPTSAAIKNWATEYDARQLAENPLADGLFLDNANGKLPFAGTPVLEATATFSTETAALIAAVRNGIGGKLLLANTSGARTEANAVTQAAGIAFEEFAIRPTEANWSQVGDLADLIGQRLAAGSTSVVIDSHPGSTATTDPRTLMGVLSYYYLVGDPQKTYLMFYGGVAPAASWQQKWTPAAAVNVGKPTGTMATFASGADPQNAALQYRVLSREYADALVLFKPRSYALGKGTGTTDNATATTHTLNGNYRELRADGTLGPVVSQMTLRNGEGAVLMKAK